MAEGHDARALAAIPRISAREAWERLRRGDKVVVVDVRKDVAHARVHVADDYHYPKREYDQRRGELPHDALLVLY